MVAGMWGGRRSGLSAVLVCAALCAAAPAAASVERSGGITYVTKRASNPADGLVTLKAKCPRDTRIVSGGLASSGGFGTTTVRHTYPFDGRDRRKKPDDGWAFVITDSGPSTYDVSAICVERRVIYVTRNQAVDSSAQTNLTVPCPEGATAIAGGHRGSAALAANSGFSVNQAWAMFLDNPTNVALPVKTYAVCARFPVAIQIASTTAGTQAQTGQVADCPSTHRRVIGGGTSNGGANGEIRINTSIWSQAGPFPSSWGVYVDNVSPDPRSFSAQAICSKPLR